MLIQLAFKRFRQFIVMLHDDHLSQGTLTMHMYGKCSDPSTRTEIFKFAHTKQARVCISEANTLLYDDQILQHSIPHSLAMHFSTHFCTDTETLDDHAFCSRLQFF